MTTQHIDLVGRFFRDEDGLVFRIDSYARGWYTSSTEDGVEQKDRLSAIEPLLLPEDYEPEAEADDEGDASPMAKQLAKYRKRYTMSITPSGRKSLSKGDEVARALEALELEALYDVCATLFSLDLRDKYAHLNLGSQRMNLGNRIRAAYRKPEHPNHAAVLDWVSSRIS